MAVNTFALNINTVNMHGVDTRYRDSSGLYYRTQISVQSIIGLQDIRIMTVQVEGVFDLHRSFITWRQNHGKNGSTQNLYISVRV